MKKVIITGPTGAIGIALINMLIEKQIEVIAVCRKGSNRIERIPKSKYVTVLECDLKDISSLSEMISGKCDTFYHFAWDGTFGNTRNNVDGQMLNIAYTLDAVRVAKKLGCKRFIGAGSQAEYGRANEALNSNTLTKPENGYGIAKLCAGQMSRLLAQQLEMEHIWMRILSIYGPYDGENTMIMYAIKNMLRNEDVSFTKCEQIWDYLYSKDAGIAMYLAGEKGINGKTYCLGSGRSRELRKYIEVIKEKINTNSMTNFDREYAENQVMYLLADISELNQDTGFTPKYSFEEGISETIEWVKNRI